MKISTFFILIILLLATACEDRGVLTLEKGAGSAGNESPDVGLKSRLWRTECVDLYGDGSRNYRSYLTFNQYTYSKMSLEFDSEAECEEGSTGFQQFGDFKSVVIFDENLSTKYGYVELPYDQGFLYYFFDGSLYVSKMEDFSLIDIETYESANQFTEYHEVFNYPEITYGG